MHEHNTAETTTAAAEGTFEVAVAETEELEVVEFGNAPLTDINFGF